MNAFRLETERLLLRCWSMSGSDREYFHYLNADNAVMRFFPFRRNKAEADAVLEQIIAATTPDGLGWLATCLKDTGEVAGFTGLSPVGFEAAFAPATEIGWRLGQSHWGKGYATEAARALRDHGFSNLGLDEIVSFAVHDNHASTRVMERIGMRGEPEHDFDHPGVPESMPDMRRHVFFRITKQNWQNKKGGPKTAFDMSQARQ